MHNVPTAATAPTTAPQSPGNTTRRQRGRAVPVPPLYTRFVVLIHIVLATRSDFPDLVCLYSLLCLASSGSSELIYSSSLP